MSMVLHCGAGRVGEDKVRSIEAPEGTDTWVPIPHAQLLDEVDKAMGMLNLIADPNGKQFGVKRDGNQMFAIYSLLNQDANSDEFGLSVGIRNSTDKSLSAAVCFGSHVFVCDNLAFSGEVVIARKHTKRILDDLPQLILDALGQFVNFKGFQERLYAELATSMLSDKDMHDFVCRAFRNNIMPVGQIAHVLDAWDTPSHEDFKPRNAWALFNAFTEAAKVGFARNPQVASDRTIRLTDMMKNEYAPHVTLIESDQSPDDADKIEVTAEVETKVSIPVMQRTMADVPRQTAITVVS